jgi:hypothetical protein
MIHSSDKPDIEAVDLPAPTAMPVILALGISLVMTGMVTNLFIGLLGGILSLVGSIGWFLEVLPHEKHVHVPIEGESFQAFTTRTLEVRPVTAETHRLILPIESFTITTGIKGGAVGGLAMVIPAALYSVLRYHSIWYAANLLAAGGFVSWIGASDAFLGQFHLQGLIAAMLIHGFTSLLVGLLYGAMLPMYPRYPILTAGLVAPLLFTAILHSAVGVVSPILNQRIDWWWFFFSLITFGLVCGYVVNRHTKVRTAQFRALPFSVRAGIESDEAARLRNISASDSDREPDRKDSTE